MYDRDKLRQELSRDEDRRRFAYDDKTGNPPALQGKLTIGVGWNLTANGLPDEVIDRLLDIGIDRAEAGLNEVLSGWRDTLDDVRQRVLLNMAFNLGGPKLSLFIHFLAHVRDRDWEGAALEMEQSNWFREVGPRAVRLVTMMRGSNA